MKRIASSCTKEGIIKCVTDFYHESPISVDDDKETRRSQGYHKARKVPLRTHVAHNLPNLTDGPPRRAFFVSISSILSSVLTSDQGSAVPPIFLSGKSAPPPPAIAALRGLDTRKAG